MKTDETWLNLVIDGFVVGETPREKTRVQHGVLRNKNQPRNRVIETFEKFNDKVKGPLMRI